MLKFSKQDIAHLVNYTYGTTTNVSNVALVNFQLAIDHLLRFMKTKASVNSPLYQYQYKALRTNLSKNVFFGNIHYHSLLNTDNNNSILNLYQNSENGEVSVYTHNWLKEGKNINSFYVENVLFDSLHSFRKNLNNPDATKNVFINFTGYQITIP